MTDPVAEMKAKAVQLVVKMHGCDVESCPICVEQAGEVAAFAAKEVERATEAERLDNAKAVCKVCADFTIAKAQLFGEVWGHSAGRENYVLCQAAPIWERAHGK